MEVVGIIASIAQISVYAGNIASTIAEIRTAVREGPSLVRERIQQLEILSIAIENIRLGYTLHSDVLATYLLTIQDKIRGIHAIVCPRPQKPIHSSTQKLRTALSFVTRNREIENRFAGLQGDCQTLYFYMCSRVPSGSDPRMAAPKVGEENIAYDRTSSDNGKEVALAPARRAPRPLQAYQAPARDLPTNAPQKGQNFSDNTAGNGSRQWFGNHLEDCSLSGQNFERNKIGDGTDQVMGSSLLPPERRQGSATNVPENQSSS